MGQTPVELSHPIHPVSPCPRVSLRLRKPGIELTLDRLTIQATVHWPIAFLTASFSLDTLQHFTPGFFERAAGGSKAGGFLAKFIPPASTVSALSVYSHAAGIAFAGVSIATGLGELYGMWKGQAEQKGGWFVALKDAYTADSDDLAANKLKTTITHASMNDAVGEYLLVGPSSSIISSYLTPLPPPVSLKQSALLCTTYTSEQLRPICRCPSSMRSCRLPRCPCCSTLRLSEASSSMTTPLAFK